MTDTPSTVETVNSFMERMWSQDVTKLTPEDFSTLISLAMIGIQQITAKEGPDAKIPTD